MGGGVRAVLTLKVAGLCVCFTHGAIVPHNSTVVNAVNRLQKVLLVAAVPLLAAACSVVSVPHRRGHLAA
jgi:hypothetical protein